MWYQRPSCQWGSLAYSTSNVCGESPDGKQTGLNLEIDRIDSIGCLLESFFHIFHSSCRILTSLPTCSGIDAAASACVRHCYGTRRQARATSVASGNVGGLATEDVPVFNPAGAGTTLNWLGGLSRSSLESALGTRRGAVYVDSLAKHVFYTKINMTPKA